MCSPRPALTYGSSSCRGSTGVLEFRPSVLNPHSGPLQVDLPLEQVLCFKHRRRVARDNTVKYQGHNLQLLPDPKRRSYAGAVVVVLEGLDGQLSVQHEGRIISAQEAPPSPGMQGRRDSTNRSYPDPRFRAIVNSFGEPSRTAELPGRPRR